MRYSFDAVRTMRLPFETAGVAASSHRRVLPEQPELGPGLLT